MHQLRPLIRKSQVNACFEIISSKGCFYYENYARQSSQVDQNFVEFLSCRVRSSLPGTGSDSHNLIHSAEVRYFSHKRSHPFCHPQGLAPVHTSFGVRPGMKIQAHTAFSATANPPFCPTVHPQQTSPDNTALLMVYFGQSFIDRRAIITNGWGFKRPSQPTAVPPTPRRLYQSVGVQKGKDTAGFPRAIIDLMVNAVCTALESLDGIGN